MKRIAVVMACAIAGCFYADVKTPLSYRTPTTVEARAEGAADVEGTACNQAVLFGLFAWGDGGYAAAVADAKSRSGARDLADVRADTTFFNVLFVYDKACTRVVAKAVR
ncbi:MAG TPA: TRL domain-containing protein [Myxococcales bacterium]|nr:TRL domain-containing protein [Myxococcales bacterium]